MALMLRRRENRFNEVVEVHESQVPQDAVPAKKFFLAIPTPLGQLFDELSLALRMPRENIEECFSKKGLIDLAARENINRYLNEGRYHHKQVAFMKEQAGLLGRSE